MKFNTLMLHGKYSADEKTGATHTPIYQSSSFHHQSAEELESIFRGTAQGFIYTRINNPTIDAFEQRLAFIENGVAATACSSGMSAITLAVMNILKSGDEIVSGSGVFGGTFSLFKCLEEFGITTRYAKDNEIESFEECVNSRTRIIFTETIGNPKLDVPALSKLAEFAHSRGIPLIVDNTATTPYLVKPIDLGADIVVHSTSKYINGSGTSIGGIIVDSGKFKWDFERFPALKEYRKFGAFVYSAKLRKGIFKDFGACISPYNAFLNSVGLETLGLRMDKLCDNAAKLAAALHQNNKLTVNYPGLPDNKYYQIAREQFNGKYGAILTIRTGSKEKAFQLINSLRYASNLANIGDVRTLVIHPGSTIYVTNSQAEKEQAGVYDDLVRISVGLEDIEDIIEDFEQAVGKI